MADSAKTVGYRKRQGNRFTLLQTKGRGDPNSRKSKLTEIEGSEFVIPCSRVIAAIGQKLEKELFVGADKLELGKRDSIIAVNENLETSRKGVFAGGDCAVGPRSLIEAMAAQGEKSSSANSRVSGRRKILL